MYPRISDLINDLFGTDIILPAKTFGFFLAAAFIVAYLVLKSELVRREKLGHFRRHKVKVKLQGPTPIRDVVIQALLWGVVLYKIGYYFVDAAEFNNDTEGVLLSLKGFWLTGLLGVGIGGGLKYRDYLKHKDEEDKFEEVLAGPAHYIGTIVTMAFVAGILGSKLFAMLDPGSNFWRDPIADLLSFNGLSFYGGLICAGGLIIWFLQRKKFGLLNSMDAFAPCLIIAYAVGRIGCQMSGDGDWGIMNPDPQPEWLSFLPAWTWSFDYPHNVAYPLAGFKLDCAQGVCNEAVQIAGCTGEYCTKLATPVYPTPFYETMMGTLIFGLLWGLRKRLKFAGQIAGIYLFFNGLERFLVESIRVNEVHSILGMNLTQAEIIATVLMLSGIVLFAWSTRTKQAQLIEPADA
ncbi:MAG: prolipoprotein diacylglyceryl transferase family protein [Bacteroidota bacterium]